MKKRDSSLHSLTRRELAGALLATAAAAQVAPEAARRAPANPAEELQAAREQNRRNGETLEGVSLPVVTEPAFHFTA